MSLNNIEDFNIDDIPDIEESDKIELNKIKKQRREGYSNLTPENIDSKDSKGVLDKLKRIWQGQRPGRA